MCLSDRSRLISSTCATFATNQADRQSVDRYAPSHESLCHRLPTPRQARSRLKMQLLNLARDRIAADAEPLRRFDFAAAREIERFANHRGFEAPRQFIHHIGEVLAQKPCDLGTQPAFPSAHG